MLEQADTFLHSKVRNLTKTRSFHAEEFTFSRKTMFITWHLSWYDVGNDFSKLATYNRAKKKKNNVERGKTPRSLSPPLAAK